MVHIIPTYSDGRGWALFCLEYLSDLSTGMTNIRTTLGWAGIFLALALKSKDKLSTMKAFRCLAQIFAAQGDDGTALSLFTVSLDGLTFMDIHRWRADCMCRIAEIERKGEITNSIALWKAARPLFKRSSQTKDIAWIDAKLVAVDSEMLEQKLQKLMDLTVSEFQFHYFLFHYFIVVLVPLNFFEGAVTGVLGQIDSSLSLVGTWRCRILRDMTVFKTSLLV
ncbi:hypothetical protein C8J57DRAFT_1235336 [Mycena rebaudengoi]|nr:hypothetical protein C8J57DRAFT_1235336 [Mycena rebaudengoi]